jgi:hypothetical protein
VRIRSLHVLGLIALAGATLHSQSYYTITPPDCSGVGGPVDVVNAAGATVGFSCFVSGTFIWFAAGEAWSTAVRVAAPESGGIGVVYSFYDATGARLNLDTTYGGGSTIMSGNGLQFSLTADQPAQVNLLGATRDAPNYNSIATGTVYAAFYCADAGTCSNVLPQLLYSALPTVPWSLSAPIVWDNAPITTQWTAQGVDDGDQHKVSFVVYNQGRQSADFVFRIYDSKGHFVETGVTKSVPCMPLLPSGIYGEAGTYGDLVANVIKRPLPSGLFKIVIDGGASIPSAVQMLQFDGTAATTMQVMSDGPPGTTAARTLGIWSARVSDAPAPVIAPLPQ